MTVKENEVSEGREKGKEYVGDEMRGSVRKR